MKINPIIMVVIRIIASLLMGFIIAYSVFWLDTALETSVLSQKTTLILGAVIAIWFSLSEGEALVVPVAHGAPLTFIGMRTSLWLSEGKYTWIGKKLSIRRYVYKGDEMAKLPNYAEGFVFVGELVLTIWNNATQEEETTLSNVTRDGSTVTTNLTVVILIEQMRLWLGSSQSILDIAERARSSFRTAAAFFTGVDCYTAKTLLGNLMAGDTIVTSFIPKEKGSHPRLSMIQDKFGTPIFERVPHGSSKEILKKAKRDFWEEVVATADPEMRRAVGFTTDFDADVKNLIEERSIDEHLCEVLEKRGAGLAHVSVGDITLSSEVEEKANLAASEVFQRDAQLSSARTMKKAAQVMLPSKATLANPGYELSTMVAAAQDNNNIDVVYVPGADRMTRAAVAGGKQVGGNK